MKQSFWPLLALCAGFVCTGFLVAQGEQSPPPAPEFNPNAWKEFSSPEGAFVVLLPGTPTKQTTTQDTVSGKMVQCIFTLETKHGNYVVSYLDFPQPPSAAFADVIFDNARDAVQVQHKGKVVSEKKIALNGHHGRELVIEAPGRSATILKTRTYLVGQRLYQAMVVQPKPTIHPSDTHEFYQLLAEKFFGSFKVAPSKAQAQP